MKEYVDLKNARTASQIETMKRIIEDDVCPFCLENLNHYHHKPIIHEGKHWVITENQYPYKSSKVQLMAIFKRHAENARELSEEEYGELLTLYKWAKMTFEIEGGGIFMREGDTEYSGGTVKHLHAQFCQPDIESRFYNDPIKMHIGKPVKEKAHFQYRELLERILREGRKEWMPYHKQFAYSVVGHLMRFPVSEGAPVITERDMSGNLINGALGEHIGFLNGAQTHEELKKYGCPWWKDWVTKERCKIFDLEEGDLGSASYGPAWTQFPDAEGPFNQIEKVVEIIKTSSLRQRTLLISPWIPSLIFGKRKVNVAPCHGWIHVFAYPNEKEIVISHFQRSADVPVGLAFNLIQYYAFGLMLAEVTGYAFKELVYYISDAHIYECQIEKVNELLKREPRKLPKLSIKKDHEVKDIKDFRPFDFILEKYNPHPKMFIPTPV